MWVFVVCFFLFLSGLYLYIIIYKAVSVLRIADCRLQYYVLQVWGRCRFACYTSGWLNMREWACWVKNTNEQTRHKQSTESTGSIQANYRSSYCCGTSAAAARSLELAQDAKSPTSKHAKYQTQSTESWSIRTRTNAKRAHRHDTRAWFW